MNAQSNVQDKPREPRPSVAVMEGKGFYNKHAAIPAAGGALALPLLEQAAKMIDLDASRRPMVLADYGSCRRRELAGAYASCNRGSAGPRRSRATDFRLPHGSSRERLQLAFSGAA